MGPLGIGRRPFGRVGRCPEWPVCPVRRRSHAAGPGRLSPGYGPLSPGYDALALVSAELCRIYAGFGDGNQG